MTPGYLGRPSKWGSRVTAFYSGHDQNNKYEGVLEGVRLACGHKDGGCFFSRLPLLLCMPPVACCRHHVLQLLASGDIESSGCEGC